MLSNIRANCTRSSRCLPPAG